MKRDLNIQELHSIYESLENYILSLNNPKMDSYEVWESGVMDLYYKILCGKVTRKDFLIFAITDMLGYLKKNNIPEPKNTLLFKFEMRYTKRDIKNELHNYFEAPPPQHKEEFISCLETREAKIINT